MQNIIQKYELFMRLKEFVYFHQFYAQEKEL